MRKVFWKTVFVGSVLLVWLVFEALALLAIEQLFPVQRRPNGLYGGGDRFAPGFLALVVCAWSANRLVGSLIRLARIGRDRWSVFRSPRDWRFD